MKCACDGGGGLGDGGLGDGGGGEGDGGLGDGGGGEGEAHVTTSMPPGFHPSGPRDSTGRILAPILAE